MNKEGKNMEEEVKYEKPPLGLVPRFVVAQKRACDILDAMRRYAGAGMEIPDEWRDELADLLDDPDIWKKPEWKKGGAK